MSAHLREIKITCDESGCPTTARVELRNTHNAHLGRFCRAHGARRLKEVLAGEKRQPVEGERR